MRTIFTTGQVAKICKVAPRTVSKWFDSGRLRGYRIPGSQDRRIPREHLIRFLKEHGMPLGELEDEAMGKVLLVGAESHTRSSLNEMMGFGDCLLPTPWGKDKTDRVPPSEPDALAIGFRSRPHCLNGEMFREKRGAFKTHLPINPFVPCLREVSDGFGRIVQFLQAALKKL